MDEIWLDIPGYENLYEVSNLGRVRSKTTKDRLNRTKYGCIKKPFNNGNGYLVVNLKRDGKQRNFTIHRLVANTFVPNINNYPIIDHIDGNKLNNTVSNLEWCTYSENNKHAFKMGLNHQLKGVDNPKHKLSTDDINFIRKNYKAYDSKYGAEALGRLFNVSSTTIKYVVWGKSYA